MVLANVGEHDINRGGPVYNRKLRKTEFYFRALFVCP
jgi:hypothetical protein